MQFPNALEGVKKIYKAEIFGLISAVVGVVAALLFLVGAGAGSAGVAAIGGVLMIAVAVLAIIAFIINIVGLNKAKLDDQNFKTALYITIVGIVASILLGFAKEGSFLSSIGDNVSDICKFLVTWFVCTGIVTLADKLGDAEMSERGLKARKYLMVSWILKIALTIIGDIFEASQSTGVAVVAFILVLIAAVIEVVVYILYLKLLSKATVMLQK